MQTLKTAAIVVLLMTVLYGAYVSLTTPPQPIPQDVVDLLEIDEELDFSIGEPEDLGDMVSFDGDPTGLDEVSIGVEPPPAANTFGGSFADLEMPGSADLESEQPKPSNRVATLPNKLPAVGTAAPVEVTPGQDYPSTGNQIDLPNPTAIEFPSGTFNSDPPQTNLPSLPSTGGEETGPTAAKTNDSPIKQVSAVQPSVNQGMANAIQTADRQYGKDQLKEALATLSLFYNESKVAATQRAQLLSRLDPLARQVIYSKRHLLEQPYRVSRGETLTEVAVKYNVPWQLLANINGIQDPVAILPGSELKVVKGPFNAQVDLENKELTLFLGDLYAGRFPIETGSDPAPKPGNFTVQDKQTRRTFYGATGAPIEPDSPNNPYGQVWIDLGGQLCIHGSPNPTRPTDQGCISLAGDYAGDLYGILSQGSSVTIRR